MTTLAFLKRAGAACLAFSGFLPNLANAASITLDAGYLRGHNGALLSNAATTANASANGGPLLLLIASGASSGTTFTTPAAGQYVAGGDTILTYVNNQTTQNGTTTGSTGGFELNVGGGTSGTGVETLNFLQNVTIPTTVNSSAYIELRWYPSITLAQYLSGTTPQAGTYYGLYNPKIINSANSLNPDGGQVWQLPGASSNITLNFFTSDDQGGSQPASAGYADFLVPGAGVPEPSTGILAGLTLVVMIGAQRVRQRLSAV